MEEKKKRYYWLKLKNTYFNQLQQKKLRKQENGAEMCIIYLKMLLLSIENDCMIYYQGVENSIEEELALEFFEDVGIVKKTLEFLKEHNMIEQQSNEYFFPEAKDSVGSESFSTERSRRCREKKKMLQCNSNETSCNEEKREEIKEEREKEIELDNTVSKDTVRSTDVQRTIETWNHLGISQVTKLNPNTKRYKMLKARIKEYGIEKVIEAIEGIDHSSFLKGGGDNGWIITFDWFVMPNNFIKVLDGNYLDDKEQTSGEEQPNSMYDEDYWQ